MIVSHTLTVAIYIQQSWTWPQLKQFKYDAAANLPQIPQAAAYVHVEKLAIQLFQGVCITLTK